jgi:hypothetical protein
MVSLLSRCFDSSTALFKLEAAQPLSAFGLRAFPHGWQDDRRPLLGLGANLAHRPCAHRCSGIRSPARLPAALGDGCCKRQHFPPGAQPQSITARFA